MLIVIETHLLGFRLYLLMSHKRNCVLALFLTRGTSNIILSLRFVVLYNLFTLQIVGYLTGTVASYFYLVMGADPKSRSSGQFTGLLVYSFTVVSVISFIKASKM